MRKFRFRLEPVLNVRKSREDEALRALGDAQRALQAELARKAALSQTLSAALARREDLGREPVGANAFQLEHSLILGTKQRIIRQDQSIVRAQRVVERAMRAY